MVKAAILTKLNSPLEVDGVMIPKDLEYGQVLVKVNVSGICGAQLQEIAGYKGNGKYLPHLIGHEGVGVVDRVGPGVTRVKEGDKVVMHWRKAAGIEAAFPKYLRWVIKNKRKASGHFVGAGSVTTLSEFAVVSENRLTPVPHEMPNDFCALLGCGLSTALGTIERDAAVKFGESVMIVGVGGLGANLIRCAKMVHASPITAVDIHENKRGLALKLGATNYVNVTNEKLTGGFDVIIDTAGSGGSMEKTIPLLNPSGRFIMVGQPKPGQSVNIENACHMFGGEGKTIKATQGGGFRPEIDIPRYVRMFQSGALSIKGIVTNHLPLNKINEAIELVRQGNASRIMIDMKL